MKTGKISVISIVLYVISGLLALYSIWTIYHSQKYISSLKEQGVLAAGSFDYDVVNFYMTNSSQYVLFAIVLFTLGWMMQRRTTVPTPADHSNSTAIEREPQAPSQIRPDDQLDDEQLESWFKSNASEEESK